MTGEKLINYFTSRDVAQALSALDLPASGTKSVRIQRLIDTERPPASLLESFETTALRRACRQTGVPSGRRAQMIQGLGSLVDTAEDASGQKRTRRHSQKSSTPPEQETAAPSESSTDASVSDTYLAGALGPPNKAAASQRVATDGSAARRAIAHQPFRRLVISKLVKRLR